MPRRPWYIFINSGQAVVAQMVLLGQAVELDLYSGSVVQIDLVLLSLVDGEDQVVLLYLGEDDGEDPY